VKNSQVLFLYLSFHLPVSEPPLIERPKMLTAERIDCIADAPLEIWLMPMHTRFRKVSSPSDCRKSPTTFRTLQKNLSHEVSVAGNAALPCLISTRADVGVPGPWIRRP
jgi:hypothetical protein